MTKKLSRSAKLKFAYWLVAVLLELLFWSVAAVIITATIILGLVLSLSHHIICIALLLELLYIAVVYSFMKGE